MNTIKDQEFGGERPLYKSENLRLEHVTIHPGESSLKECKNMEAEDCRFEGKYVFWETYGFRIRNCYFAESARSSLWYSRDVDMRDCLVDAPKMFRRMQGIRLENVQFPHGEEMLWDCRDIEMKNVEIHNCDYLAMHAENVRIDNYRQNGNYSFQYARNVEIHNAVINSKDAFWESEDCTLVDCEINGEYLAWYAKNFTLIRCHITETQPLCYCENLRLEDCTFGDDADLALEYSTVNGNIRGHVVSIKNPTSGTVRVESLGELIIDQNQKAPADAVIVKA